ncbi:MAG TPA: LuxR C-terminal-related transcriptional regulator [Propionibacteriaceae bacterium]|nr:LuxR C-terminal-related transcriptional regulator [Propionibacteriaceae bacterium]
MTVDREAATPTVAELEQLLLDAKLSVPQARRGSVSRAKLIETGRASDFRVVAVTAPAGYGKSTLLAQWARAEDRRVAWASLDRFDDDPAVLLSLLAAAYARVSPGSADLIADMSGPGVSALGRAAPLLASVFRTSPFPFVLMLDDLHELQSPACHDVLSVVISGIPPGSQLVSASRSEQPHLPRLRASGDVLEFLGSDLALDAAGAEQIFAAAHVSLTPELAAAVTERTEGWPVGLYLAALISHDSHGGAPMVFGDDRYVADYLYRESLMNLPEDIQRFLRRTAVLDQLSAPLCDAILEESGGQAQLRVLEATNLFLIPLDRRREWYRYHALFQEFLLGELRRVEPELMIKLHLRAADWYESNGLPAMAIEHLLKTTERDRCVQLVTRLALPTYQAGQMSTVQRWLSVLGDSAIEQYSPLAVLAGWVTALTGQTADAQRWAAIIDAASFDQVPADGTASFDSARAMLRVIMCPAGPEQAMADASFAVAAEPPWSPWRDQALCLRGEAHLLAGDVDQAEVWFAESSALADTMGNADSLVLSESERALLAMDSGRWADAAKLLEVALAAIDEHRMHDYALCVLAFAGAARLAVHRGDLKEADRRLTQAMRARPSCTLVLPFIAVRVRLQLAKVYWIRGDPATARQLLREIDDILQHRPALGTLVEEVSEFRRITSTAQVGVTGGSPLSPAELRLLPYLQTHLTFVEIGARLFISRNTVSTEVASVYRKLGVSSRKDAVQHATSIGLLGG